MSCVGKLGGSDNHLLYGGHTLWENNQDSPLRIKRMPGPSSTVSLNMVAPDSCLHSDFQFLNFFPRWPSNSALSLHFALTSLIAPNHYTLSVVYLY